MRLVNDMNILSSTCNKFCDVLEKHTKYIVVSGFVAISTGRSRGTEDIDVIISKLSKNEFIQLHLDLEKNDFECIQGKNASELFDFYLKENLSIRYILIGQLLPDMEIKMSKDALDEYQIEHRVKIPLSGLNLWFSSIETNLAFKEELLKSEKDLEDAKHLRTVFEGEINEKEVNKIKELIRRCRLS